MLQSLSLQSIQLWECSVTRGDAESISPGRIDGNVNVEHAVFDESVEFMVSADYDFFNADDEMMAKIHTSFVLSYDTDRADEFTEESVRAFVRSVIVQATPFQRELVATLTNRLGLPPFFLPLVRSRDLKLRERETADKSAD